MAIGLCDGPGSKDCKEDIGDNPDHREWACDHCPKKRYVDLMDYTQKLLRLRMLRLGGYPFDKNELTYDEWLDLGKLEQWLPTPGL